MHKIFFLLFLFILTPSLLAAESASNDLSNAIQAQKKGEYNAALIHFKNAVQKEPDNIDIKLALAAYYVQVGIGTQAEIELDKATFLGASQKDVQLLKIKSQLIQGKFKEVTSQIDTVLNIAPNDIARIRALQGQAYLNQGNIEKARSFFLRGSRLAPDALEVKIGLARLYIIDKKKKPAKKLIESLYSQYPNDVDVLLLMANLYREQQKYSQAHKIFKTATEIQPGNTAAWLGIVTSLIGEEKYTEADENIGNLLSVDAEHETGNHLQAIIAYHLQDYSKAQQALKLIEKNNRNHKGILLVSGSVYYQLGKMDLAEQKLQEFLEFKPNDLAARKMLSAVYLKRKQGSQAIKLLQPFAETNDISVLSLLSSAYKLIGNQQKSSYYLEKAISLDPDNQQMLAQQRLNTVLSNSSNEIELRDDNFDDFNGIGLPKVLQHFKKNEIDKAIEVISAYQQKDPDNYVFYNLLAQAYQKKNDIDNARANLNKVLEINPDYLQARISLARIAAAQNEIKKARREYHRVLTKDSSNEMAMLDLARLSLNENNEKNMLTWLNKAMRSNQSAIKPRIILNNYYQKKNQFNDALKISMELVELQPDNVSILKMHADNLIKKKELSEAIWVYKKIVELRPDSPKAHYWLASAQFLNNDDINARNSFSNVLSLDPKHLVARSAVIKLDLKAKKYNDALAQSQALVKLHPKSQIAHETLGDVWMLMKQADEALKTYKKGLAIQDNNYLLVNKIAQTYALTGHINNAAEFFEEWLKTHPENIQIRMSLALLYQQIRQPEQARLHYEYVIKVKPDNVSAINNLALVYAELNDPRSFEYAEIAYSLAPENAGVLDTLGWLLVNIEPKRALHLLKQATDDNPSDFDIRYHYAVALSKNQFIREAKVQLNMIVPVPGRFEARQEAKALLEKL